MGVKEHWFMQRDRGRGGREKRRTSRVLKPPGMHVQHFVFSVLM